MSHFQETKGIHAESTPICMSSSVERAASSPEQKRSFFWSCFSCRALSGGALIASSLFVYSGPLRIMSHRIPPSMGNIAQMTFAVCKWGSSPSHPVCFQHLALSG
uniref:Distal membrane-arm assembly complex protein 1-like domain-containing protein n=1 Tax=Podarcis muralis TaxID=64176 RepID=A0A670JMF6_PODMU